MQFNRGKKVGASDSDQTAGFTLFIAIAEVFGSDRIGPLDERRKVISLVGLICKGERERWTGFNSGFMLQKIETERVCWINVDRNGVGNLHLIK